MTEAMRTDAIDESVLAEVGSRADGHASTDGVELDPRNPRGRRLEDSDDEFESDDKGDDDEDEPLDERG